jgi:hypothetical protein
MKAKTVNEIQKFQRGLDPKDAMQTGDIYQRNFIKIESKLTDIVQEAFEVGITLKDIQEIFYGSIHINTGYSYETYLTDPNMP